MNEIDVTVIGGGLAGMAVSIHLAKARMSGLAGTLSVARA
jgi:cation diffusion facilitator CzcD-associated flavoprotein CzcO